MRRRPHSPKPSAGALSRSLAVLVVGKERAELGERLVGLNVANRHATTNSKRLVVEMAQHHVIAQTDALVIAQFRREDIDAFRRRIEEKRRLRRGVEAIEPRLEPPFAHTSSLSQAPGDGQAPCYT